MPKSQFSWNRRSAGYVVVDGQPWRRDEVERVVVQAIKVRLVTDPFTGESEPTLEAVGTDERYQPPSDLILTFAGTPTTEEGVLGFANRFGLLGIPQHYQLLFVADVAEGGNGEPLSAWFTAITQMRGAEALARAVAKEDLDECFRALDDLGELVQHDPSPPDLLSDSDVPSTDDLTTLFTSEEPEVQLAAAWGVLEGVINEQLRNTSPVVGRTPGDSRPTLGLTSKTLLGKMWVQLMEVVTGTRELRPCKARGCAKWFPISVSDATGHTEAREFCGDACKAKDYRQRKATARELFKSGMAVEAIAERVRSDAETVEGWVGGK